MHGYGHMMNSWGGEIVILIPLLIAIGLLVCLFAILWAKKNDQDRGDRPLDTLKRRYARGEITQDEFEKAEEELAGR